MQADSSNIRKFLEFNATTEQVAAILAHAEDGKLSFISCCCFVGCVTAPHPLKAENNDVEDYRHLVAAQHLPYAKEAESEFRDLGKGDYERRKNVIPILREEMERRASSPTILDAEREMEVAK